MRWEFNRGESRREGSREKRNGLAALDFAND
jgi:hypothetical protein